MPTKLEKELERECNSLSALAGVQLTKIKRLEAKIRKLEKRIAALKPASK